MHGIVDFKPPNSASQVLKLGTPVIMPNIFQPMTPQEHSTPSPHMPHLASGLWGLTIHLVYEDEPLQVATFRFEVSGGKRQAKGMVGKQAGSSAFEGGST